mmetsp:Transcript_52937/g.123949  ORF Transcript_52937/g.123949 Transcript_52937/m.123949 type:complete len:557 (+) Transcript_52937:77-1747(+)
MLRISIVATSLWQAVAATNEVTTTGTAFTTGLPATCGCGWHHHSACSISSHQFVQALQHSRVDEMCTVTNGHGDPALTSEADPDKVWAKYRATKECGMRKEIRVRAKALEKCIGVSDPKGCMAMDGCYWGAQAAHECGVDVNAFLNDLLGEEASGHPLLLALQVHNYCSAFDYSSCEAPTTGNKCSWRRGACDLNPSVFFHILIHRPSLLNIFLLTRGGSMCRAHYEHGQADGEDGVCEDPCLLEYGICRLNVSQVGHFPFRPDQNHSAENITKQMVNNLCMRMGRPVVHSGQTENFTAECRDPCVTVHHNFSGRVRTFCRGPSELPNNMNISTNLGFDEKDWLVAEAFMVLQSATMIYEHHCHAFSDNYDMCQASSVNCEEDWKPIFTTTTYAVGDNIFNVSTVRPPVDGGLFKGILAEVGHAVEENKLPELFGDVVESVARQQKITEKDQQDALNRFFKPPKEEQLHQDVKTKSPWEKDEDEKDVDEDEKEKMGLFMIGSSFLFAAVCGGLALGVLCSTAMGGGPRDLRPQLLHGYNDQEAGRRGAIPETLEAE